MPRKKKVESEFEVGVLDRGHPNLLQGEAHVEVRSVIGVKKGEDDSANTYEPAVLLALEGDGKRLGIPLDIEHAQEIGVQLISAANSALTDVILVRLAPELRVEPAQMMMLLQLVATTREELSKETNDE